jgi:hypothetical protein
MNGLTAEYTRLDEYCINRNALLRHYMGHYKVSRNSIKNLFTAIGFGGSYKSWFSKNNIEFDNDAFIVELNAEYYKLAELIYDANKNICEDILKAIPHKFIDYTEPSALLSKKKRTTMAMFYQTAERYCQEAVISFLCQSRVFNFKDIVPCQDGFMILAPLMYPTICDDCERVIKQQFKMDLQFLVKEFDERFEIPAYISDKDKQLALKQQQKEQKEQALALKATEREQKKIDKEELKQQKKREIEATKQTIKQQKEEQKEEKKNEYIEKDRQILIETISRHTNEDNVNTLPSGQTFSTDIEDPKTRWILDGCMHDKAAAEKLFELYPYWITSCGDMYVFDYTTGMYSSNVIIYNKIISKHSDFLHIMLKDETHKKEWYRSDCRSYGNTSVLLDKIITLLKTLNVNNDWLKKSQSSSLGKILFENGYYDFTEQKLYDKFNPNIVFFGKIHHKFEAFTDDDRHPIQEVMLDFHRWCGGYTNMWANGPAFDIVILEQVCKQLKRGYPWQFWQVRDTRTVYNLVEHERPNPRLHHAAWDCWSQIVALQSCFRNLNIKKYPEKK